MTDTPTPGAAPAAPAKPRLQLTWPETRDVIAVLSTVLFAVAYAAPWLWGMPKNADQYVGQAQGALLVQWAGIMSWYFGSSKGSSAKDAVISALSQEAAK